MPKLVKQQQDASAVRQELLRWLNSEAGRTITHSKERDAIVRNLDRVTVDFLLRYRSPYDLAFMLLCLDYL